MMLFLALFCLFSAILCTVSAINSARFGQTGWVIALTIFAVLNYGCCIWDLYRYNEEIEEPKTYVIKDVKEYYIDSTSVINDADTTKTYTLTYIK